MNITPQTVIVQSSKIPSSELDGGRVFLDIESGDYLSLKGPGFAVWKSLETPLGVGDLFERLATRYGIDRDRCAQDTMPFLEELLSAGLVEVCTRDAPT